MKKIIFIFLLFTSSFVNSQELMNFYLEDNGTGNSITLTTKVYDYNISIFDNMEQIIAGNTITVSLCYYRTLISAFTLDMQNFTIDIPNGSGNYSIIIKLYKDVDYPTCDYINLVDEGNINFDYPYIDTATTYIPDDNFEEYIETLYEGDGIPNNDLVLTSRIENIYRLFLNNNVEPPLLQVLDPTGIEDFISLKYFWCQDNLFTDLDVSNSIDLLHLYCSGTPLNNLDISGNSNLERLMCDHTNLTNLNLNNNSSLNFLYCHNSLLTQLDLSNNSLLEDLDCSYNNLEQLDLSYNPALIVLECPENNISSINFMNCESLEQINCENNMLTELDVSPLINLKHLSCSFNLLEEIDLSYNTLLEVFSCPFSDLTFINVQNGNNENITNFITLMNFDLECIQVDDEEATCLQGWNVDTWTQFSEDCSTIGIDEISSNNAIELYPNPATQQLFINNENNTNIISLHIYDSIGKIVLEEYTHFQEIDIQILKPRVYWVQIETENGMLVRKFIKY